MKFLQKLGRYLVNFLPSKAVAPSEPLARYIFSSSHFKAANHEVLASAFIPSSPPKKVETSVSRIKGLSERKICSGGNEVGKISNRKLKAWAELLAESVTQAGAKTNPDPWPMRHAAIVGWPENKPEQMIIAGKMALRSKLKLPPQNTHCQI
jgi:hypothetical protein